MDHPTLISFILLYTGYIRWYIQLYVFLTAKWPLWQLLIVEHVFFFEYHMRDKEGIISEVWESCQYKELHLSFLELGNLPQGGNHGKLLLKYGNSAPREGSICPFQSSWSWKCLSRSPKIGVILHGRNFSDHFLSWHSEMKKHVWMTGIQYPTMSMTSRLLRG